MHETTFSKFVNTIYKRIGVSLTRFARAATSCVCRPTDAGPVLSGLRQVTHVATDEAQAAVTVIFRCRLITVGSMAQGWKYMVQSLLYLCDPFNEQQPDALESPPDWRPCDLYVVDVLEFWKCFVLTFLASVAPIALCEFCLTLACLARSALSVDRAVCVLQTQVSNTCCQHKIILVIIIHVIIIIVKFLQRSLITVLFGIFAPSVWGKLSCFG